MGAGKTTHYSQPNYSMLVGAALQQQALVVMGPRAAFVTAASQTLLANR